MKRLKKSYIENSKKISLFFVIFLLGFLLVTPNWDGTKAISGNSDSYNIEALPPLSQPTKGTVYNDPSYGTSILRLTDSNDGSTANVAYSYWPVFNSNSTRLLIGIDWNPTLYNFNPTSFTFQKQGSVFDCNCAAMQWEGMTWSATDPDIVYGISGYNSNALLRGYNVVTKQFTFVHDFTAAGELPIGSPAQMSKARSNDRYFSFHWRPANSNAAKYAVVYDKTLNKTYLFDVQNPAYAISNFDECRLDRDGNYLVISTGREFHVWKFASQSPSQQTIVQYNGSERAGGHGDFGSALHVQVDIWGNNGNRTIKRSLASPQTWQQIFDSGISDWNTDQHISLLGPDDTWALISTQTRPADYNKPFSNEIFLAKTDGSGQTIKLLQPRSSNSNYSVTPFGNLSPDGRFVAYQSDWGGGRCDVYIAKLPTGLWNNTQPVINPPTAEAIATPATGTVPLAVGFSASGSSSPNGSITSYSWNFGDGTTGTGLYVSHTYTVAGSYNAILKITDSANQTASKNLTITVSPALVQPPVAQIVATPTSGNAPLNVVFDGGFSTSPNGAITTYSWNFGDNTSGTGKTITHTYQASGNYVATLTVTDTLNQTAVSSLTINATSSAVNKSIMFVNGDGKSSSQTYDTSILTISYPNYTIDTSFDGRIGGPFGATTLIVLPQIIGTGANQIPPGAKIVSATLTLSIYSSQATSITAARILDPNNRGMWYTGASLSNDNVGVSFNFRDARSRTRKNWATTNSNLFQVLAPIDSSVMLNGGEANGHKLNLNVTSSVAAWAAGAVNQGWAIRATSITPNSIFVYDSLNYTNRRPVLNVQYTTSQ